jgi:hypothetical protein
MFNVHRTMAPCIRLILLAAFVAPIRADERLAGIACRSVHLQYPAPEGTAFYNEVTIEQSSEGTYVCACGFRQGYFGLQELASGKKVVIFSVWEPGAQNDPNSVKEERRVKLIAKDDQVRVGRFGNEGTGGQSFLDYDWKPGETYRFLVKATVEGERTSFAAYFRPPDATRWRHLATFSTLTGGNLLGGYYSFIEDFRRNRVSATKERRARFGNGWVKARDGREVPLARARFTADRNPAENIDAGSDGTSFFLATGGEVKNEHARLQQEFDHPPGTPPELP